jgi:hypothetical protein
MSDMFRVITCPFCLKQNVARAHLNVICSCGAKFYIFNNEFWDRKTGKIVKNPRFELLELEK